MAGTRATRQNSTVPAAQAQATALYAAHDVTWYWIVDPDARTIEAYRLEGSESEWLDDVLSRAADAAQVGRLAGGQRGEVVQPVPGGQF